MSHSRQSKTTRLQIATGTGTCSIIFDAAFSIGTGLECAGIAGPVR